jgi:hypothetical protein
MPDAQCARSLVCEMEKAHKHSHHGHTGTARHSKRNGFTGSFVLFPGTGLSCPRHRRKSASADLTPASGRQNHTTSPSATARFRRAHASRPPHPAPNVRDDREAPLLAGVERRELVPVIWGWDQWCDLRPIGTTGKSLAAPKIESRGLSFPATNAERLRKGARVQRASPESMAPRECWQKWKWILGLRLTAFPGTTVVASAALAGASLQIAVNEYTAQFRLCLCRRFMNC